MAGPFMSCSRHRRRARPMPLRSCSTDEGRKTKDERRRTTDDRPTTNDDLEQTDDIIVNRKSKIVNLGADWPVIAQQPRHPPASGVSADNLAYLIYTSGSTGTPKGAMNSHRGIVNRLLWMQEQYGLAPGDVVLQKTPFSFDVSVWEIFWPLLTGARLVLARPGGHRDPAYLAGVIE